MVDSFPKIKTEPVAEDHAIDLLVRSDENIQLNTTKSKRHSSLVRRMRLILPVLALAVFVILITWKSDNASLAPVPRAEISPETVAQNELVKPKFQSEDKSGQPYTITADKATQNAGDMDTLFLAAPVADVTLKSGGWVSLKATDGIYQQSTGNLDLNQDVKIRNESGYEIRTEKMNINVKNQKVTSTTPVTGEGPDASISATGLSVDGNAKTLIFTGPAKLTFHPKEKE
jgi:lipopolysaccharide export system protein LptC